MFDAAFGDVGDIPFPNLFRFQRLMLFFGEGCRFQTAILPGKAPPV